MTAVPKHGVRADRASSLSAIRPIAMIFRSLETAIRFAVTRRTFLAGTRATISLFVISSSTQAIGR